MKAAKPLLPKSIQERAINNMIAGMTAEASVKKAFEDEETMIYSLLGNCGGLSREGKEIAKAMGKEVYDRINATK